MASRKKPRASQQEHPLSAPAARTARWSRWAPAYVLGAFSLCWLALAMGSSAGRSATFDEPLHLVSGYAALTKGDFRVDPSHPPLVRLWAALPLAFGSKPQPRTDIIDGMNGQQWLASSEDTRLARRFLHGEVDADRELVRARFMIMILAIGLGALIFLWTREWLGLRAGVLALAMFGLSPNILAHGALVTTDLGAAAFMFGAVYFLWRLSRHWSAANAAGVAGFVAAAAVTKFSSLMLAPVLVLLLAVAVWKHAAITPRRAVALLAVLLGTTVAAIWAVYGFRYLPSPSPGWAYALHDHTDLAQKAPFVAGVIGWVDSWRLLPNAFSQGLLYCVATSGQPAYLLGEYSSTGWWYYFPVAFLVKTPVTLLALLAAGIALQVRRSRENSSLNFLFIAVPAVLFTALSMVSHVNIGLRHLLPAYPFVFMFAGAAADRWLASPVRIARPAFAAVAIFGVMEVAMVYPRTLTYFNVAAGGPANGLAYLSDSNLDWGQHLKALKAWMNRTGVKQINLAYFGQADPAYYKIDCIYLPGTPWMMRRVTAPPKLPGFVAISATVQSGVYLPPEWRLFYQGFRGRSPVTRIGNTISVYWVDNWPEGAGEGETRQGETDAELALADRLLGVLHWPQQAVRHYQRYLRQRPNDVIALQGLGHALVSSGNVGAGLSAFREAVASSPEDSSARINLVLALLDHDGAAEAVDHARETTRLLPDQPASWRLYGRALELTGRRQEAATQFERAVQLNPGSEDAKHDLARVRGR